MKRYYFQNRTVKARGFTLKITSGGTIYHDNGGCYEKLNTMWLKHLNQMYVSLPNGKGVRLKPEKDGKITVITEGFGV